VGISIDGPEPIHDAFRQAGSFQRALKAMDTLAAGGILVSVISTLHSSNVSHLDELYDVLKEKPLFAWQLQACSPMGNAAHGGLSTQIDFGAVIRFVEEHMGQDHFAVGIADNIGYYTQSEGWLRGSLSGDAVFAGCRAGLTNIGIDSVGNVRGCESMYDDSFIEGNLRERPLIEIWNDPNAFSYNRRFELGMLSGKCRTCEQSRRCAGGCRSYNHFSHGKLYESPCCAR
jgi:radical SAM protein with 4Fe4S-binding SPASM domain